MDDEKTPLHTSFPDADSVQVGARGRIRWPLWISVLVCLSLLAALSLFIAMSWPSEALLMGSLKLIHIDGHKADLWLGYSGACGLLTAFLNAYFNRTFAHVNLDTLDGSVPGNLGYESALLLAALCTQCLGAIFIIWGALDYYRAETWHFEQRRGWVSEWLISRRLDLLGSACSIGAIAAGSACASSTSIKLSAAASAVNTLAAATRSDYSHAETGRGALAIFAACILSGIAIFIELLVLAFDGLGHRIRSDYEDLVDDVQQLENENWVALEAKMHTLQQLALRHTKAESHPDVDRRERARLALVNYLKASDIDHLLDEMQDVVTKHRQQVSQIREQSQIAGPPHAPDTLRNVAAEVVGGRQGHVGMQRIANPRTMPSARPEALSSMLERVDRRERRPKTAATSDRSSLALFNESPLSDMHSNTPQLPALGVKRPPLAPVGQNTSTPLADSASARRQVYFANAAAAENELANSDIPRQYRGLKASAPVGQLGVQLSDGATPSNLSPHPGRDPRQFVPVFGRAF